MDILHVLSHRQRTGQEVNYRLFDLLFCEGCIGGPMMVNDLTFFERKKYVVRYMAGRPAVREPEALAWTRDYLTMDLTATFQPVVREVVDAPEEEIRRILAPWVRGARGAGRRGGAPAPGGRAGRRGARGPEDARDRRVQGHGAHHAAVRRATP